MLGRYDHLFTQDRLAAWGRALVVAYVLALAAWIGMSTGGVDRAGIPLGADFVQFYAGGGMALDGRAADAFDAAKLQAATRSLFASDNPFLWNYPPTLFLLVVPFSLLPYFPALAAYSVSSLGLYLWAARRLAPHRLQLLLALAFPAAYLVVVHGQNTFFVVAVLALGFRHLATRPVLAGLLFGLASFKPHIGVLLPFALMAGGYWRAFAAATLSTILLALAAGLCFGFEAWGAFFRNLPVIAQIMRDSPDLWPKMASVFATSRMLGAPDAVAVTLQGAVSVGLSAATIWAWSREGDLELKVALLVVATLLVSPYLMNYDLILLGIPVALLARRAAERGDRSGAAMLVAISFTPFLLGIAVATRIQIVAPLLWWFYGSVWLDRARPATRPPARPDGGSRAIRRPRPWNPSGIPRHHVDEIRRGATGDQGTGSGPASSLSSQGSSAPTRRMTVSAGQ